MKIKTDKTLSQIRDSLEELYRERNTRERIYPNWVYRGKLKQATADNRLQRLNDAIDILECVHDAIVDTMPQQTLLHMETVNE